MEDFEPLSLGWYRRSGRPDRQFFFYIETTSIIAGTATLQMPPSAINPRWGRFADVTRISQGVKEDLSERL